MEITSLLSKVIPKEQRDELVLKFLQPGNCERMNVIQCNNFVYKNVPINLQNIDNKIFRKATAIPSLQEEASKDFSLVLVEATTLLCNDSNGLDFFVGPNLN